MNVQPAPAKKTPWLAIILGAIAVLCLCIVVIGAGALAFFLPTRSSATVTEQPVQVVTQVATETEIAQPTVPPTQESTNPLFAEAAPVGSAVDIGDKMTLTVLNATRPVDDIVENGSVLNAAAPEGEEYMQVDVQVACAGESGSPCTFYPTEIKVILSDGSKRDLQTFIDGVDDWDTAVDIEGGTTQKGFLLFIVPKSETSLILSYEDVYADQAVHMQLP